MTKAIKASRKKKAAPGAQFLQVKAVVDLRDDSHAIYANYAEVAHSHNEFAIIFAHTPPKLPATKLKHAMETGEILVEPVVQLIVPPTLIPGLINALRLQRESYEEKFGKIYVSGEGNDGE